MACLKLEYTDVGRYMLEGQKQDQNLYMFSTSPLEASHKHVLIQDTDQASFLFEKPFSGIPNVIVGFIAISPTLNNPNVNVYVESVTRTGGIIRTSAPVMSASIAIHAIYNELSA